MGADKSNSHLFGSDRLLETMWAFQQGDRSAFDALYGVMWPRVCLRAHKMGLGPEEGEEIAQKVLVRVYLHAGKAQFESKGRLWSWVYTITAREVYKHWKRKRPELVSEEGLERLEAQPTDASNDPVTHAVGAEVLSDADDCIERLSDADRLYLLGPLVHGLTFRQAAAAHGLTLGRFKHRYGKALEAVRGCMEAKGHDLRETRRTNNGAGD